jgi:ATP-dependent Clp protease ATP-binding subunit ClpA
LNHRCRVSISHGTNCTSVSSVWLSVQVDGAMDAANILKPALARGSLHCIGATTFAEYERYIAKDGALARRFQPVVVDEPSPQESRVILGGLQGKYEDFHRVRFSAAALDAAVSCATQFVSDRKLPDAAIDLMDEAAALRNMQQKCPGMSERAASVWRGRDVGVVPAGRACKQAAKADGGMEAAKWAVEGLLSKNQKVMHDHNLITTNNHLSQSGQTHPHSNPARLPKACPHCGEAVNDALTATLLCPSCETLFLNIAQHELMLGTSVLPPLNRSVSSSSQVVDWRPNGHNHAGPSLQEEPAGSPRVPPTPAPKQSQVHHTASSSAAEGSPQCRGVTALPEVAQDGLSSTIDALGSSTRPDRADSRGDVLSVEGEADLIRVREGGKDRCVEREHVLAVVSAQTGIPQGQLSADAAWFATFKESLAAEVWGQDAAIRWAPACTSLQGAVFPASGASLM